MSFWHELPKPFLILAPMEAVTDIVFRKVVAKAAKPDVFFSEFTNATGWAAAGDRAIGGRLIREDSEGPMVAQLWGSKPEAMALLATHCKELGFDGIDINMGCPVAHATKSGGGSGMIRTPELAAEMIAAAKSSGLPVSVKTRLGYSKLDEWPAWLEHILKQEIENLTIHLRTRKEMSKVPAHFELIPAIKELRDRVAPNTLLTINGDIETRAQALGIIEETGVDGAMIGRGVFKDPFCFAETTDWRVQYAAYKTGEPVEYGHPRSKETLIELMKYHLDTYDEYAHLTGRPFDTLKRFFKIYIRDFDGASELRDKLMHSKNTDEVRVLLDASLASSIR